MDFSSLRDCKAWLDSGLELTTTSNEACKMYDAALRQYTTWQNNATLGGIEGCVSRIKDADPNFVMGHILDNGLKLIGTGHSVLVDEEFANAVKSAIALAKKQSITKRERLHVSAMDLFSRGCLPEACNLWEKILLDHPTDMLALKFTHDTYFYLGWQQQMRDSIVRVLPHWKPEIPLYWNVKGMLSFGLVETNFYDQAEKTAKEVLAMNPMDAWSVHSVAHVHEMKAEVQKGLTFMESTENDWKDKDMLACHNYWHWALYFIEKGEYETALSMYDNHISTGCFKSGTMLDIVDTCSMLYRLQMEGVNVGDRWKKLTKVTKRHVRNHLLVFNDIHILMSLLGSKDKEAFDQLIGTLKERIREPGENHQLKIAKQFGIHLCEAFIAYENGNYSQAVELLYPVRYDIIKIGGSNAQRDVFSQLLIHSALNSENKEHQKIARCLLAERDILRPNSPMTKRLIQRATAIHGVA